MYQTIPTGWGFGMLSSRFMFYEMKAAGAKEQSIVYWRRGSPPKTKITTGTDGSEHASKLFWLMIVGDYTTLQFMIIICWYMLCYYPTYLELSCYQGLPSEKRLGLIGSSSIFQNSWCASTILRLGLARFGLLAAQHVSTDEGQAHPGPLWRPVLECWPRGSTTLADWTNRLSFGGCWDARALDYWMDGTKCEDGSCNSSLRTSEHSLDWGCLEWNLAAPSLPSRTIWYLALFLVSGIRK